MGKEGARCGIVQSGLTPEWWAFAGRHFCAQHNLFEKNIVAIVADDRPDLKSPHWKRFGRQFHGKFFPYGALVYYLPTPSPADQRDKFGPKAPLGLFLGWVFHPGGVWSGDYEVLDWDSIRLNPNAKPTSHSVRIHRTSSIFFADRIRERPTRHLVPVRAQATPGMGPEVLSTGEVTRGVPS